MASTILGSAEKKERRRESASAELREPEIMQHLSGSATAGGGGGINVSNKGRACSHIAALRLGFVVCMLAAASICGTVAYFVIARLFDRTFDSIATQALEGAQIIFSRRVRGARAVAKIHSLAFPNATQWPFVSLPNYSAITNEMSILSALNLRTEEDPDGFGMNPFVRPDQVPEFEAFAKQTYAAEGYHAGAGVSKEFGFGIFRRLPNRTRYHDVTGAADFERDHSFLAPLFTVTQYLTANYLLINMYGEPWTANPVDVMISCAQSEGVSPGDCGFVTDVHEAPRDPGPAAVFGVPIVPSNDPSQVVGMITSGIDWEDALKLLIPDYVCGIDAVISTETTSSTFAICGGKPHYVGSGDLHDPTYEDQARSVQLNDLVSGASASTVSYLLTLYATPKFYDEFEVTSPMAVSIGLVAVILLCTIVFFIYDYFVMTEARQRQLVLNVKRRFVRVIVRFSALPIPKVLFI